MQKIGVRIRKWREERGIDRARLAETAGLTEAFLAALEDDDLLPSLGPLQKIARALGVRLGTFMDDQATRDPVVARACDRAEDPAIRRSREADPSFHYTALARGKSDRNMEPFYLELSADARDETTTHQGEEFLYVLEGSVRVEYGREVHLLGVGDSIYYNSLVPHSIHAVNGPARLLTVIYFPE